MTMVSVLANGQRVRTGSDWKKIQPLVHQIRLIEVGMCGGGNETARILALPIHTQKHLGRMKDQSHTYRMRSL